MRCLTLLLSLLFVFSPVNADDQVFEGNSCFSIIAGKDATLDGSVIMAHNEDDYNPQVVIHRKIPRKTYPLGATLMVDGGGMLEQVPETWSYIWSEIPGLLFSDSYLTEWGVCICSNACPSREDQPDITDGGITYMLRRIVAERAKSAREGVHIAAMLVERFGYGSSGRTYSISDPNEGWVFCAINGKRWVAQRVPDNQVMMIANTYSVHEINLADTINFLGSRDLVDYATKRGWYNPAVDSVFDFASAYADPEDAADRRNIDRQWDGFSQVAQGVVPRDQELPLAVVPRAKLGVRDFMSVLRRHYESTEIYAIDSVTGCPHANRTTPICRNDTQTSFVVQLRNNMPADLGLVYWTALSSPCVSCYIPFYFGIDSFPQVYGGPSIAPTKEEYLRWVERSDAEEASSAFWGFTRMKYWAEQRYTDLAPSIRETFEKVESNALAAQSLVDVEAKKAYVQDKHQAATILSDYSGGILKSALEKLLLLEGDSARRGQAGGPNSRPGRR